MPQTRIERRYTRDARIPLVAGDDDWIYGFQCIPLPPSLDDGWVIFDTSKDYKTGWMRVVRRLDS
jgi:hypothetical protein